VLHDEHGVALVAQLQQHLVHALDSSLSPEWRSSKLSPIVDLSARLGISPARAACDNRQMNRLASLLVVCAIGVLAPVPALASTSGTQLWRALGGQVMCGIAIHPPNSPPMQLLCSARAVPAPKGKGIGDPGFVFLGSVGRPERARLSQDSFVGTHAVKLSRGSSWRVGPIAVKCTIGARAVRCTNRSHHGFAITKSSYRAF
jgi:hypothetical protein